MAERNRPDDPNQEAEATELTRSIREADSNRGEGFIEDAETLSGSGVPVPDDRPEGLPETIGHYTIVGKLGEGGMGVVFEAEQERPRRRVALKVMRSSHAVDALHAKMFQREVETLGRLKHPNIASIYESGHTDGGRDFFAMELVQGMTLDRQPPPRSRCRDHRGEGAGEGTRQTLRFGGRRGRRCRPVSRIAADPRQAAERGLPDPQDDLAPSVAIRVRRSFSRPGGGLRYRDGTALGRLATESPTGGSSRA